MIVKRFSQSKFFFAIKILFLNQNSFFESNPHPDSGSDLHLVRAVCGPQFRQNPQETTGFIRGWLRKEGAIGPRRAGLRPASPGPPEFFFESEFFFCNQFFFESNPAGLGQVQKVDSKIIILIKVVMLIEILFWDFGFEKRTSLFPNEL